MNKQSKKKKKQQKTTQYLFIIIAVILLSAIISLITKWSVFITIPIVFISYIAALVYYKNKARKKRKYNRSKQLVNYVTDAKVQTEKVDRPTTYNTANKSSKSSETPVRKLSSADLFKKSDKNLIKAEKNFDIIKSADFSDNIYTHVTEDKNDADMFETDKSSVKKDESRISWRDLYRINIDDSSSPATYDDMSDDINDDISDDNLNEYELKSDVNKKEDEYDVTYDEKSYEQNTKSEQSSKYEEIFLDPISPDSINDSETASIISRINNLLKKPDSYSHISRSVSAKMKNEPIYEEENVKVDPAILEEIFHERTEPKTAPGHKNNRLKKSVDFIKNKFFKDSSDDASQKSDDNGTSLNDEDIDDEFDDCGEDFINVSDNIDESDEISDSIEIMADDYSIPLNILSFTKRDVSSAPDEEALANAGKLIETLASFGVGAKIVNISRGPSVTRYEIQPESGVKVSRIVRLADDIALNLASSGVRIEAPIPGKAAVGIEVPNSEVDIVHLSDIISSDEFQEHKSMLAFAVGMDVSGKVVIGDIRKMPHLLIAGATGSGKSVCINTLIASILYKASPEDVKLVMIDPKVVELGIYNGIPHLLVPVVTDPKKAAGALNWAVQEMERRYALFADRNVRDIRSYNDSVRQTGIEKLPQIVVIIDELADLMMVASNDVEDYICRLAQKARAAGIHLVVATQRPSVDVITGLIKANIPSRIAFSVSSQVDSRTIIDMVGAEKLLGRGDMLFSPMGQPKPIRVQGAFVSDKEIENLVEYVKNHYGNANYSDDILNQIDQKSDNKNKDKNEDDDSFNEDERLLFQAVELVIEFNQASVSFLQRKLKLGYSRAARIMDQMEDLGVVSSNDGSKPRQVLITKEQWNELNE